VVVGVLTTSYPRWPGDFAGAFVADRVEVLRAQGHAVEVIAAGAGDLIEESEGGDASSVTRLPARFGPPPAPALFAGGAPEAFERGGAQVYLSAVRFVVGLCAAVKARAAGWDRIESHWLAPCALAASAAVPGLPHRAFAHSGDITLLERVPLGRALARRLATSPSTELVFASQALRRRFVVLAGAESGRAGDLNIGTVEIRHPPRDLFTLAGGAGPVRSRPRDFQPDFRPAVVSVGRLVPIKGYDLLLHACARAGVASVAIVGEGPERDRLQTLGARLGVPLRLPGVVPRPQVASWLRSADLYVQPSRVLRVGAGVRTEGTPVATLEALAVGLPVVASDSGGLAELAAQGAAVQLFPAGDVAALAALIRGHDVADPRHVCNARVT
jgi:glycosyltransferase involved in cell wall biosynthesis